MRWSGMPARTKAGFAYVGSLRGPILLVLVGLCSLPGWGQPFRPLDRRAYPQGTYVAPLAEPLSLSGSFGEVRARHFHAGTDLRTGGQEGQPVYAVAEGQIVRISIATKGYGLALYVAHPNGSMSVYGHLQRFVPEVAEWVRAQQYAQQQYVIELYPQAGQFPVLPGQVIAYSGNTGSSGGPHLHFELRLTEGNVPYNSYLSGVRYADTAPPQFFRLYTYAIDTARYGESLRRRKVVRVLGGKGRYYVPDTLVLPSPCGLGVEVRDPVNPRSLVCNVAGLQMLLDTGMRYAFNVDQVAFEETHYADAHIDYQLYIQSKKRVHLLFRLPGNLLSRSAAMGRGLLALPRGEVRRVTIVAYDIAGNRSTLHLTVKGGTPVPAGAETGLPKIPWARGGTLQGDSFTLQVPPMTLYYDLGIRAEALWRDTADFAPAVDIGPDGTPLHRPCQLKINTKGVPEALRDKLYLGRWNARGKRYEYYATPVRQGDVYECSLREFGRYALQVDSTAPAVRYRGLRTICHRNVTGSDRLTFHVGDRGSRVAKLEGLVDGSWMLLEYEPKAGRAVYMLDSSRIAPRTTHQLWLRVSDELGNASEVSCPFVW